MRVMCVCIELWQESVELLMEMLASTGMKVDEGKLKAFFAQYVNCHNCCSVVCYNRFGYRSLSLPMLLFSAMVIRLCLSFGFIKV
jgi:hypothetical protein